MVSGVSSGEMAYMLSCDKASSKEPCRSSSVVPEVAFSMTVLIVSHLSTIARKSDLFLIADCRAFRVYSRRFRPTYLRNGKDVRCGSKDAFR